MKHYSKSLDLLLASQQAALKGKHEQSAKLFAKALVQRDLKATMAGLEQIQAANFARKGAKKLVKANDSDIFNETIDEMTVEAEFDDILELPVASADNGNGESELDFGNDDASDLDFSPTDAVEGDLGEDIEGLDDLADLSDEDFGDEDFGTEFANTTGEGDLDSREGPTEDPNDTPEGEPAEDFGPVPEAEDTTVVSRLKQVAGKAGKQTAGTKAPATKAPAVQRLNRVHSNLAALQRMSALTTIARRATKK